jgi:hypothetical protein
MSTDVYGLWLNRVPKEILREDSNVKEICKLMLQGKRAKGIFVADRSLLLSIDERLQPHSFIIAGAQSLREFLKSKKVSRKVMDRITISPYTNRRKWEVLKEQISVGVSKRSWNTKAPEDWRIADTLKWLRDQNLGQYCLSFRENDIDGRTLIELNERDLQDLGIRSVGHRKTLMRFLNDVRYFKPKSQDFFEEEAEPVSSFVFPRSAPVPKNRSYEFPPTQDKPLYLTVMIRGFSHSFLKDGNALFDIKNKVFADYAVETFDANPSGIQITFKSPMTTSKRELLKEKLTTFIKNVRFEGKVKGNVTVHCQKNKKVVHSEPS